MTEALITLSASIAQLGVAAAAYKVALEVKAAVVPIKSKINNHEERIVKLEER